MLSREEIKKWLLDNCVDCNGDLNLSDLDFNDFEGDIFINHWKVKHNMCFRKHKVQGNLWQSYQEVQGNLYQSWQVVMKDLNQYHQEVQGDLNQSWQRVRGDLYQFDQVVFGDLCSQKLNKNEEWVEYGDYVSREKKEVIKNVD